MSLPLSCPRRSKHVDQWDLHVPSNFQAVDELQDLHKPYTKNFHRIFRMVLNIIYDFTSLVDAMRILALVLFASPSMLTVPTVFVLMVLTGLYM